LLFIITKRELRGKKENCKGRWVLAGKKKKSGFRVGSSRKGNRWKPTLKKAGGRVTQIDQTNVGGGGGGGGGCWGGGGGGDSFP